jgi:iron-sulfur cluster repair protein YtfE (RIC family)
MTPPVQLREQISLPGQTHVAEGPYDQTPMYLMHHAFRRDLRRIEAAVRATPLGEVPVWNALARRWDRFAEVLHHHHQVEDEYIWPVLEQHAADDGETSATQMLHAMEAEHAQIDPALAAVEASFRAMAAHPCADHRNALDVRVTAVRAALLEHLRHEETDALPYLQRVATPEEEKAMAQGAERGYPLSITPFVVPWVAEEVPDELIRPFLREAGAVFALMLRVCRGRFRRGERAAFRYA